MRRFITISAKHAEEVIILMRNAVAGAAGVDAYQWLKKHLSQRNIAHNDQNASHPNELPHQGGYVSFYMDQDGNWKQVKH